jgi:hypothetical protein
MRRYLLILHALTSVVADFKKMLICMSVAGDTTGSMKKEIEALRHDRTLPAEQIKHSQVTIARCLELLKRIDEMPAKAGEKP